MKSFGDQRRRFLLQLWEATGGKLYDFCGMYQIGATATPPLTRVQVEAVVKYLLDRGGLEGTIDGEVALTGEGLAELDRLEAEAAPARHYGAINITGKENVVNLGDGARVEVTKVTVGDLLQALPLAVNAKVADPEQRRTLLQRLNDLLRHPAALEVLKTSLPELADLVKKSSGS